MRRSRRIRSETAARRSGPSARRPAAAGAHAATRASVSARVSRVPPRRMERRHDDAMIAAGQKTYQMGRDQADEADAPPAVVTAVAVSAGGRTEQRDARPATSATPSVCDSISPRASTFKLRAPAVAKHADEQQDRRAPPARTARTTDPPSARRACRAVGSHPRARASG